jgi:hypothetical protein
VAIRGCESASGTWRLRHGSLFGRSSRQCAYFCFLLVDVHLFSFTGRSSVFGYQRL